jgi:hypothetical protein
LFEYLNGHSNEIDPREEILMGEKKMTVGSTTRSADQTRRDQTRGGIADVIHTIAIVL